MGLTTAGMIAARLIEAGRQGSTPVAVVEGASLESERRIVTTLADLGLAVEGRGGPAILIIGEVAALAAEQALVNLDATPPPSRGRDQGRGAAQAVAASFEQAANAARPPAPGPSPSRGEGSRKAAAR